MRVLSRRSRRGGRLERSCSQHSRPCLVSYSFDGYSSLRTYILHSLVVFLLALAFGHSLQQVGTLTAFPFAFVFGVGPSLHDTT
jgi:uncharacterized membrane protein